MNVTIWKLIIVFTCSFLIYSCNESPQKKQKYIDEFKGTEIEPLVNAIYKEDIKRIDDLIRDKPSLLNYTDSKYGSGVLEICISFEKYDSFKRLLELGADSNYINPINHYSILIESIRPFGSDTEWRQDNRYSFLLLKYKADPNYSTNRTEDNKGYSHIGYSPLTKASSHNLEIVKKLVKYGGDINKRVDGTLPFAIAVSSGKSDIVDYYIDSLKVNLKEPLQIRSKDSLFIQDYIDKFYSYKKGSEGFVKTQQFIRRLETKGVDFKNYSFKSSSNSK